MDKDDRISAYLREFQPESEVLKEVRGRSEQAGIALVPAETGALLSWCARLVGARHAVEIGTGGGYSALWLLAGMDPRGTLTTIELNPEHQAIAQRAFADGKAADRVRSMLGAALTVLPKLADDHYDLVFLDAVKSEYSDYLTHAKRLLRPGGLLLADNVLWSGRVADPEQSDESTEALRSFTVAVRDDPDLDATIAPVGDGVLIAVYRPEGGGS